MYPNSIWPRDPQPKRNKSADNPYSIYTVGIDTENPRFFVEFIDGEGIFQQIEVSEDVYEVFNGSELRDISYLHEIERHHEQYDQIEDALNQRLDEFQMTVDEQVEERMEAEALYKCMERLSDTQRRRIVMYYFEGLKLEEIAELEGCAFQVVQKSIKRSIKNLKKFLKTG